jgi:hypothetical protein
MFQTMQKMNNKKKKDRYRLQFCEPAFYENNLSTFKMWKSLFSNLNHEEKAMAWFAGLACLRCPDTWYMGLRSPVFLETANAQHPLSFHDIFKNTPVQISKKIDPHLKIDTFLNTTKIKAIPESCARSICFLYGKKYNVLTTLATPTPEDLLKLQINGQRILTYNENYEDWPHTLYAHRDYLGFMMHDLIHADHFFKDNQNQLGQIGFYKFVHQILMSETLNPLLANEGFKTDFEYIISDMNAHPIHLFQTLHSAFFRHSQNRPIAEILWSTQSLQLPDLAQKAFLNINTTRFTESDGEALTKHCFKLAQSAIN